MSAAAEQLIQARPVALPRVEFFDTKVKDRQTVRWLAFAGDRVTVRQKQEIDWLRAGGIITDSKCVNRWGTQFIPRGYAAIVEEGANLMPMEHLRNVGVQVWHGISVDGQPQQQNDVMGFTVTYPGDAIQNILSRAHNDQGMRNGMTELSCLYGKQWAEAHRPDGQGFLDILETACFGDGQEVTLRGLMDQIRVGTRSTEEKYQAFKIDIGKYRDEWLQSGSEFRDWGMARLQREHANLRQGTTAGGLVFEYSPTAELLLTQLEVVRQDRSAVDQLREQIGQMGNTQSNHDPVDLIELGRKLALAEIRANEAEAKLAAAQIKEPEPQPAEFTCDACQKPFDTAQGLSMHKTRYCKPE